MQFPSPLVPGRLIRRYKRFLADVTLEDGREVVAHCANPGSMMGLAEPGMRVWLEPNDDPKKKLKFGWRLVEVPGGFVGVDTGVPNRALKAALEAGEVAAFAGYDSVRAEVPYGAGSRVDFLLTGGDAPDLWLEVKSVTLSRQDGLAEFPDSVTRRGAKHLDELAGRVRAGDRAALLYLVQRTDCDRVCVAADIDPAYAAALDAARGAGVEIMALAAKIDVTGITVGGPLPVL
ncbi:DNA/RNA nuclease SfsA [Pseudaestuariivita atlantica]|uniref:Sugar fermentation stimulation protein homolog n=1 Tax=Pseudaestuariivita atlantica TaxID=1317121 RepID=A0A0L1JSD5_9RHOB|nr:DNA/RNA nuclease SfsA [Pseudaestuariivita atlantica]KNG94699.1 sugar fermentation stimulation protein [Pseudaestuariivita atlantica]